MFANPALTTYLMLVLVGVAGACGDILVSRWAKTNGTGWLLGSWVFWIISVTLFGYFLKSDRFAFSTAIFIAFAAHGILSLLFELAVLKTKLSREEWLGMALAIIAVLVLEVGRSRREEAAVNPTASVAALDAHQSEVQ
jgi:multidrug transporter EmrE-like cation transporter